MRKLRDHLPNGFSFQDRVGHGECKPCLQEDLAHFAKLFLANLLFKINGKSLTLSFLGKQVNNDETLLLFFESKLPKNILEVSISNSILTKTFSDQQNIVHLTGIVKESFTFNENLTTKSYYLNN